MAVPKTLPSGLIDSLLADYKKPEDLIGEHELLKQLTKALVERALQAERPALGINLSGRNCWASGLPRPKERSSGCRWPPS